MKTAKTEWNADDFGRAFKAACRNGNIRAMAVIKPWLFWYSYSELGFADQPAAVILLNKWCKMSDTNLLKTLNFEFNGIAHLRKTLPPRINKLLARRGLYLFGFP